jgi:hypothetical protein
MTLSEEQQREIVRLRLASAEQALADAATLLQEGSLRGAANRCYYAASSLAAADGRQFRKHSALIAWFHQTYTRPERLPRRLGRTLQKAFDTRSETDYEDVLRFSTEDVRQIMAECMEFVRAVREHVLKA